MDYLAEELRYTYAPLLASGQLILSILRCEQNGHEQLLSLDALEPEWDGDAVELPETKLDLGGGRSPSAAATDSSSRARATPSIIKATWRRAASRSA